MDFRGYRFQFVLDVRYFDSKRAHPLAVRLILSAILGEINGILNDHSAADDRDNQGQSQIEGGRENSYPAQPRGNPQLEGTFLQFTLLFRDFRLNRLKFDTNCQQLFFERAAERDKFIVIERFEKVVEQEAAAEGAITSTSGSRR